MLFADPGVATHYLHDSPYTYFTSDELHLGEISLECSRAGAAAAALWLTLQLLPLTPEGLGAVLRPGRRAALAWAERIEASDELTLYQRPQLDILTYFPTRSSLSEVDAASAHVLNSGMERPSAEALYVATYSVNAADLEGRRPPNRGRRAPRPHSAQRVNEARNRGTRASAPRPGPRPARRIPAAADSAEPRTCRKLLIIKSVGHYLWAVSAGS